MSYANKRGRAKAFDSGIAGAEFITTPQRHRNQTSGECPSSGSAVHQPQNTQSILACAPFGFDFQILEDEVEFNGWVPLDV